MAIVKQDPPEQEPGVDLCIEFNRSVTYGQRRMINSDGDYTSGPCPIRYWVQIDLINPKTGQAYTKDDRHAERKHLAEQCEIGDIEHYHQRLGLEDDEIEDFLMALVASNHSYHYRGGLCDHPQLERDYFYNLGGKSKKGKKNVSH